VADPALPHRRLRDHGADHASLVPGVHRRDCLPHPGPGLGARCPRLRALAADPQSGGGCRHSQRRRAGRAQEVQYYNNHYTRTTPFLQEGGPQRAYEFAHNQHGKRIGIAGSGEIFFGQYGFYGANLDNRVQYIGVPGPDGTYRLATSCPQFRRRINAGDYDYLILSRFTQDSIDAPYWYPVYRWVRSDPAVKKIVEEPDIAPQPDYVFKVNGKLDPAGCDEIPPEKTLG
jgi:hypothetical protein